MICTDDRVLALKDRALRMRDTRVRAIKSYGDLYQEAREGSGLHLACFLTGNDCQTALKASWEMHYLDELLSELEKGDYCNFHDFCTSARNEIIHLASSSCLQGVSIWSGIREDARRQAAVEVLNWVESFLPWGLKENHRAISEKRTAAGNRQPQGQGAGTSDDVLGQAPAGKP